MERKRCFFVFFLMRLSSKFKPSYIRSTAGPTAFGSWSLFHSFVVIQIVERMVGSSVARAAPISAWLPYRSAQSSCVYPSAIALRGCSTRGAQHIGAHRRSGGGHGGMALWCDPSL